MSAEEKPSRKQNKIKTRHSQLIANRHTSSRPLTRPLPDLVFSATFSFPFLSLKTQHFIRMFGKFFPAIFTCAAGALLSPRSSAVNMYFMSRRDAPAGITIGLIKRSALPVRLITQADELIPDDSGSRFQLALSPTRSPLHPLALRLCLAGMIGWLGQEWGLHVCIRVRAEPRSNRGI